MYKRSNIITCMLIYFSLLYPLTHADVCVKKSSCVCEFSNGTGIDLSSAVKSTFYSVDTFETNADESQYSFSTYLYHPCFDALPITNKSVANNTCTTSLSLCRYKKNLTLNNAKGTFVFDEGLYEYMGTSNNTEFSADGSSIIYNNGPSSTIVQLVCAEGENKLIVDSLGDPKNIVLRFYSRNACLAKIDEPGRSFGSTLLIIFFSFVVFYLVLGICTKKFLMGATGIEVIPNLGFWTDLPNLVKDGWAFMINGFKLPTRGAGPVTSPDPNSYDSI
ncbi:Cation-dependent mannose-6-phosphate receptor [Papilio xuthus]|uniref:Cation-dependent mannose-6-phosphate receptor n=1 Tax=Papilio xuthus TaxID=66420 RepID=A0A194PNA6_PAPXU|nr:Cation-dependent mannose-6-phosphate receptor [Papilio xuthus]